MFGPLGFIMSNPLVIVVFALAAGNVYYALQAFAFDPKTGGAGVKVYIIVFLAVDGVLLFGMFMKFAQEAWPKFVLAQEVAGYGAEVDAFAGRTEKTGALVEELRQEVAKMKKTIATLEKLEETVKDMADEGEMDNMAEKFEELLAETQRTLDELNKNITEKVEQESELYQREVSDYYSKVFLGFAEGATDFDIDVDEWEIFVMTLANSHHVRAFARALSNDISDDQQATFDAEITGKGRELQAVDLLKVFAWIKMKEGNLIPGKAFFEDVFGDFREILKEDFGKLIQQTGVSVANTRLSQIDKKPPTPPEEENEDAGEDGAPADGAGDDGAGVLESSDEL